MEYGLGDLYTNFDPGSGGALDAAIAGAFAKYKVPNAMGGQGIDMLVPTLLEWGTEEQKQEHIESTLHGQTVWCQGYSEPNAGSDLASLQTKGELIDGKWVITDKKYGLVLHNILK